MLGPAKERVLRALRRYFYLTAIQVGLACGYSPRSITHVQTQLKELADLGYALRLFLPRPSQHGSAPSVYCLARRGLNHLRAEGLDVTARYRPSERQETHLHLSHTLCLNDWLISIELACHRVSQIELAGLAHERQLKRRLASGREVGDGSVVPDAWLDLRLRGTYQMPLVVELDRSTEEQRKWRRKVRLLVGWAHGAYRQAFGTDSITILVVTTGGERRLSTLLRWTEQELASLGREEAELFRLTTFTRERQVPEDIFFRPLWRVPFAEEAVCLLDRQALLPPVP